MPVPASSSLWWSVFLQHILVCVNYSWYFWVHITFNTVGLYAAHVHSVLIMVNMVSHSVVLNTNKPCSCFHCPERTLLCPPPLFSKSGGTIVWLISPSFSKLAHREAAYFPSWWMNVYMNPPPSFTFIYFFLYFAISSFLYVFSAKVFALSVFLFSHYCYAGSDNAPNKVAGNWKGTDTFEVNWYSEGIPSHTAD